MLWLIVRMNSNSRRVALPAAVSTKCAQQTKCRVVKRRRV
jgi:hypothetical protein